MAISSLRVPHVSPLRRGFGLPPTFHSKPGHIAWHSKLLTQITPKSAQIGAAAQ
jgi:hypothetical protein